MEPTLIDCLERHGADRLRSPKFTFVEDGQVSAVLTFSDLAHRARCAAAHFREICQPGDRAVLILPSGLPFIELFVGCLYAGVIAVPLHLGHSTHETSRVWRCIRNSGAKVVVCSDRCSRLLIESAGTVDTGIHWVGFDSFINGREAFQGFPRGGDALAFLQYTSGSTSAPRGVRVTHANILANSEMIRTVFGHGEDTVMGGWLPLHHDMGLTGLVMHPIWLGGCSYFMAPSAFIQKPLRWLELVARFRITTSGGPSFGYDLCARAAAVEEPAENLDLSCWNIAFNGAEPVRYDVIERFTRAFASRGFARSAFLPCYGLAEATLLVCGNARGNCRAIEVDLDKLESEHVAVAPMEGRPKRTLVSCGRPAENLAVRVVNPETREIALEGTVGEIWLSGPSIAGGYWDAPDYSHLFDQSVVPHDGGKYLRTGDLGLWQERELFITGRLRDLIIIRGRNHYPEDIEFEIQNAHPAFAGMMGAAFSVRRDEDEEDKVIVIHEIRREFAMEPVPEELYDAARHAVVRTHGLSVHRLVFVSPRTLPRTSSGKIQRHRAREQFLAGSLRVLGPDG